MAVSDMGENVLCGSHVVWALRTQAPGLAFLATSLHVVGTQPLRRHQQRGHGGLGETAGAKSRPKRFPAAAYPN